VTPATVTVGVGQSSTLEAALKDAFNNTLTGRIVTWTSSDPAIATVSAEGVVTGVKPGATTVLAQSGQKTAAVTVNVTSAFNLKGQTLALGESGFDGGFTCAIAISRDAYCWGNNQNGQLGDGSQTQRLTPVPVSGGQKFQTITAGHRFACALNEDSKAYCWGGGDFGVLGDGSRYEQRAVPAPVSGDRRFRYIGAGNAHVCGLAEDGAVYCWGTNYWGELGNGRSGNGQGGGTADALTPEKVNLSAVVREIAVASRSACALTVSGDVYCWGEGGAGQMGDGRQQQSNPNPIKVLGGYRFEALAAGGHTLCGQIESGTTYCWGASYSGQLGFGGNSSVPQPVLFAGRNLRSLGLGMDHLCGIDPDGDVFCSGSNEWGALGSTAISTNSSSPVSVNLGGKKASTVIAGSLSTCAILRDGGMVCWGQNLGGELGNGTTSNKIAPTPIEGDKQFASLSAGAYSVCGLDSNGKAACWGGFGWEWGSPVNTILSPYSTAPGFSFTAISRSKGGFFACAVQSQGQGYCWGGGWNGQLGNGSTNGNSVPSRVATSDPLSSIVTGSDHACGLTSLGKALCWGENNVGQVGDGTFERRLTPVAVTGNHTFAQLAAGQRHTCGIKADGTAFCWGANGFFGLGSGLTVDRSATPVAVAGGLKFAKIFPGYDGVTCGIVVTPAGKLYCWGNNGVGQLGVGTAGPPIPLPVAVNSTLTFTQVALGWQFGCGLTTTGQTHCWGNNGYGELAQSIPIGTITGSPTPLSAPVAFVSIVAGERFACGVTDAKVTYCWGLNRMGSVTARLQAPSPVSTSTVFRGSR